MEKFEKVVKWTNKNGGITLNNKNVLWFMFVSMIPIVGQFVWLVFLSCALSEREIYWRKVK